MGSFFDLSQDLQINELEHFAHDILKHYPIEVASAVSINYEYNATLKVKATNGQMFALRININSPRTPENLKAEIAWVRSLAQNSRVLVPEPIANNDGNFYTSIFHEASQRTLHCVLYSWLSGAELGDEPTEEQLHALGAAMATMHLASKDFSCPAGSTLPSFIDPLWETEDFLLSEKSVLDSPTREVISQAMDVIRSETQRLFSENEPQIIHADLHGWNVMWNNGTLAVFDFDDCGFGLPLQDLATAIYYLDTQEQDAALKEGYASVAPLPKFTQRDMDMLLLQRRIVLLNYLYETSNLEHRSMIPEYQEETLRRIAKFLGAPELAP
jgi:Ser/Thr protein kinase RdoA (MazF antagonist)